MNHAETFLSSVAVGLLKIAAPGIDERAKAIDAVTDDLTAADAAQLVTDIKTMIRPVTTEKANIVKGLRATIKSVDEAYDTLVAPATLALGRLTGMINVYAAERAERLSREGAALRAAAREKLREENAAKIDEITIQISQQLETLAAPETPTATRIALSRRIAELTEELDALGVDAIPGGPMKETTKAGSDKISIPGGSITTRQVLSFRILDESIIPREYLMVDENKIRAGLLKGEQIPGVEAVHETATRINAARV